MPLIDVGEKAPPFTLPDQGGKPTKLASCAGQPVVLFFYPKDDTSGCTKEACAFRDLLPRFDAGQATVFGVSPDGPESHAKFIAKHDLNFTLLADAPVDRTPTVCDAYGVWQEKSMYGRKYMGVVRTTYLINANGDVARRWDKVKVPGHAEAVLEALGEL